MSRCSVVAPNVAIASGRRPSSEMITTWLVMRPERAGVGDDPGVERVGGGAHAVASAKTTTRAESREPRAQSRVRETIRRGIEGHAGRALPVRRAERRVVSARVEAAAEEQDRHRA